MNNCHLTNNRQEVSPAAKQRPHSLESIYFTQCTHRSADNAGELQTCVSRAKPAKLPQHIPPADTEHQLTTVAIQNTRSAHSQNTKPAEIHRERPSTTTTGRIELLHQKQLLSYPICANLSQNLHCLAIPSTVGDRHGGCVCFGLRSLSAMLSV